MKYIKTFAGILALTLFTSAMAQTDQRANLDRIDIVTREQKSLYAGWAAADLIGLEVRDSSNEDMGAIESVFVGADGKISRIVVAAGGFLNIGTTVFAVTWDRVTVGPNLGYVQVPISKDSYTGFSLFNDNETIAIGPREWRVSELIGDYVTLKEGVRYGIVDDLIFDNGGNLQAVIVNPVTGAGVRGYYAYPYYGSQHSYNPGLVTYKTPYGRNEIENLQPFDISKVKQDKS
jgi:sporulation protein YlmC with PRC-barrel domain